MDLFGVKFSIALGAWRLRFVLMLEDVEAPVTAAAKPALAHRASMQHLLN